MERDRNGTHVQDGIIHQRTLNISSGERYLDRVDGKNEDTPGNRECGYGAQCVDLDGTVAAGASTGGVDVMLPGRVGDTPLIGCGVYADNEAGAVSMTGLGESIIRVAVAKEISDLLASGLSPLRSANRVLRKVVERIHGTAGVLVLSPDGRFAIRHSTPNMVAGVIGRDGRPHVKGRFA